MTGQLPDSAGQVAQQADDFNWDGHALEPGIALTLSGGGFRAMLFHAGALVRLNELGVLSKVARISSVSGGSIAAGHLACVWKLLGTPNAAGVFARFQETYFEPLLAFSRERIGIGDIVHGLLPWTSAAEQVAATFDGSLFGDKTLQDLPDTPRFVFCATNMQTGVLFRFSKSYAGDYLIGRLAAPTLPLSTAVAASTAFPPFFSPLVLALPEGSFTGWSDDAVGHFDAAPYRDRIHLADGGVYDNLGLEPVVKRYMTILASDGGAPFGRSADMGTDPIRQLQRVFDVTGNQVRALRRRDLIARYQAAAKAGLQPDQVDPYARLGAYWGIDTDPANVAPAGALPCGPATVTGLANLASSMSDLGDTPSRQLVNWGYAICDRCVRVHYDAILQQSPAPKWPCPEQPLG